MVLTEAVKPIHHLHGSAVTTRTLHVRLRMRTQKLKWSTGSCRSHRERNKRFWPLKAIWLLHPPNRPSQRTTACCCLSLQVWIHSKSLGHYIIGRVMRKCSLISFNGSSERTVNTISLFVQLPIYQRMYKITSKSSLGLTPKAKCSARVLSGSWTLVFRLYSGVLLVDLHLRSRSRWKAWTSLSVWVTSSAAAATPTSSSTSSKDR